MKNALILLGLFFVTNLSAQTFEFQYTSSVAAPDLTQDPITDQAGNHYLLCDNGRVIKTDINGNVVWNVRPYDITGNAAQQLEFIKPETGNSMCMLSASPLKLVVTASLNINNPALDSRTR